MATTTPFPFASHHDPEVYGEHLNETIGVLIAEYESALGDSDKAGEVDTAAYHEGRAEAFADCLLMLLQVPPAVWDAWNERPHVTFGVPGVRVWHTAGGRQYTGRPDVMLEDGTDPWLQHPDGSLVELEPYLAELPAGTCGECVDGFFAPTGNGPTTQGIERCDACDQYAGDLDAAVALAEHIGAGVTVWYQPEES